MEKSAAMDQAQECAAALKKLLVATLSTTDEFKQAATTLGSSALNLSRSLQQLRGGDVLSQELATERSSEIKSASLKLIRVAQQANSHHNGVEVYDGRDFGEEIRMLGRELAQLLTSLITAFSQAKTAHSNAHLDTKTSAPGPSHGTTTPTTRNTAKTPVESDSTMCRAAPAVVPSACPSPLPLSPTLPNSTPVPAGSVPFLETTPNGIGSNIKVSYRTANRPKLSICTRGAVAAQPKHPIQNGEGSSEYWRLRCLELEAEVQRLKDQNGNLQQEIETLLGEIESLHQAFFEAQQGTVTEMA